MPSSLAMFYEAIEKKKKKKQEIRMKEGRKEIRLRSFK